jgi:hypothetical protein
VLEGGEEGGAGVAHDVLLCLVGGFREVLERCGQEGEVGIHQAMNFSYQLKCWGTSGKSVILRHPLRMLDDPEING